MSPGLKPADKVDSVVKAAMFGGANATASNRYGEMSLAGAGSACQELRRSARKRLERGRTRGAH
jgi:hypothetical protein